MPVESRRMSAIILQVVVAGVAQGCVYGLIALGFVLIYKATETVNFAQGELMMLGAFSALVGTQVLGMSFWLSGALSIAVMGAFGWLVERLVISPVLGQPAFSIVMLTFGLGLVARGAVTMIPGVGTDTHTLLTPYKGVVFDLGGAVIAAEQTVIITATGLLCGVLFALFRYTRIGVAMQASSQNQLAAYYMGIPVRRLNGIVWALAAGVATVAGMLLAPLTFVHANMGFIGLKAFPAAIVGGFGSLPGAIVGGVIIGLAESLSGFFLPEGVKDVVPYIVVLFMLVVRPTGLFGHRAPKKV
jgi:branched-chain amino acid transport system permease protein